MRQLTGPTRLPTAVYGLALLTGLASCTAEDELDPFADLIDDTGFRQATAATDEPLPQSVLDDIAATLPESQDATVAHPELFPAGFDPNPHVVTADTDVWITFVQEGASYHSAMGYFTYPAGSPPASLTQQQLEDGLIFADASGTGAGLAGGGSLYNGVRMSLGTFQPGVQIGFYLVRNGACDDPGVGTCSSLGVDFTHPIYTTVDAMNPEHATDPGLARHVVMADLLDDPASDARLLSFEDKDRLGDSDDDFNDVVFRVTASPALGCDDCIDISSGEPDLIVFRSSSNGALVAECRYDDSSMDYACGTQGTSCQGPYCIASGVWSPQVVMTGDVNGVDGHEIVQFNRGWLSMPTMFRQPDGDYISRNAIAYCTECPYSPPGSHGIFGGATHIAMGDFDGNGRSDVAQFRGLGDWLTVPMCRFDSTNIRWNCGNYEARCTPGGANCQGRNLYPAQSVMGANTDPASSGDELVQYHPNWQSLPTCRFTDTGSYGRWHCDNVSATCNPATSTSCGSGGSGIWGAALTTAGDFDGDGMDEIAQFDPSFMSIPVCFYDSGANVYRCDNTPASCMAGGDCSVSNGGSGIQPGTERIVATDVNEDGCDDIVMQNDGWGFYGTCLSPCTSSTEWLAGNAAWECDQSGALCSGDCGNYGSGVWPSSGHHSGEAT